MKKDAGLSGVMFVDYYVKLVNIVELVGHLELSRAEMKNTFR